MKKIVIIVAAIILLFSLESGAQPQPPLPQYKIEIDIVSRSLYFYENNNVVKKYPIAVGKASTQTPIGDYKIINKVVNPYYSKKKIAGGSPQNPLGSRWMGFKPSYGIHGNNNPKSIGTFVSEGCVRMYDKDVKELYEKITVGVPVTVKYEPIKIERDMENDNPIVIVYPDYYSKVPNLVKLVGEKLSELSLIQKIDSNKLATLKKQINKEIVVFSDKWVYMINGNYITNDVIFRDSTLYINLDKVCKFLKIDVCSTESTETVMILSNNISIIEESGSRYVSINQLEANLGGSHKIHQEQQTIKLDLNYLLFNNKFVKGEVLNIEGDVAISLDSLYSISNKELTISQEKSNVIVNNKEIKCKPVNGKLYIALKDLLLQTNLKSNTYTKDKYIEVFREPL